MDRSLVGSSPWDHKDIVEQLSTHIRTFQRGLLQAKSGVELQLCSILLNAFSVSTETCCLVIQLCLTLCDHMDCSTLGFPVLHYLLEVAQTHVH